MNLLKQRLTKRKPFIKKEKIIEPMEEKGFNDNDLLKSLTSQDIEVEESREEKVRKNEDYLLHSTMIDDLCIRRIMLAREMNIELSTPSNSFFKVDSNMQLVWAIGRAVETHIRSKLIKEIGVVNSWGGKVTCLCGKEQHELNYQRNHELVTCEHCNTPNNSIYHEMNLRDIDNHSSGGVDFGYWNKNKKLVLCEIKSIKKEGGNGFEALKEPQQPHINQVVHYNKTAKLLGYDVANYVNIIYGCKSFLTRNVNNAIPYKIFKVKISDAVTAVVKSKTLMEKGKLFKLTQEKKERGERICSSISCNRAKGCQMNALCFTLD